MKVLSEGFVKALPIVPGAYWVKRSPEHRKPELVELVYVCGILYVQQGGHLIPLSKSVLEWLWRGPLFGIDELSDQTDTRRTVQEFYSEAIERMAQECMAIDQRATPAERERVARLVTKEVA